MPLLLLQCTSRADKGRSQWKEIVSCRSRGKYRSTSVVQIDLHPYYVRLRDWSRSWDLVSHDKDDTNDLSTYARTSFRYWLVATPYIARLILKNIRSVVSMRS